MRRFYPLLLAVALISVTVASWGQDSSQPSSKQDVKQEGAKQPNVQTDQQPVPEEMPVTVKPSQTGNKKTVDNDPVMGVPPLPPGKTSMIGGRLTGIDGVHNRLGVKVFGANKWEIAFDERTHFYRDGQETTFANIKKGDRVYVDTMSDKRGMFARNVRVVTNATPADARGQVLSVDNGMVRLRDDLSSRPVQFSLSEQTQIKRDGRATGLNELQPGALVAVQFAPAHDGRPTAREIKVLAAPGQNVTFAGKVTHLDLRSGLFAVANRTDNRTYDIAFDRQRSLPSNLMVGSEVTVAAEFDGRQYKANHIDVDHAAQ
jgi:Domain of unknown function (DUF5666)